MMDWGKFEDELTRREYSYYQIERIKRAEEIFMHHPECEECAKAKANLVEIYENVPSLRESVDLEKKHEDFINSFIKHFKEEHKIYSVFYFTSLYSFFGILIGGIFSVALWFFNCPSKIALMLFVAFVVVSYLAGSRKDNFYRFKRKII